MFGLVVVVCGFYINKNARTGAGQAALKRVKLKKKAVADKAHLDILMYQYHSCLYNTYYNSEYSMPIYYMNINSCNIYV